LPEDRIDSTIHYVEGDKYSYVVGGRTDYAPYNDDDIQYPSEVLKFDVKDLRLSTLGYMKEGRRKAGTMKTTTSLWVFGGCRRQDRPFINRIERIRTEDPNACFEEVTLPN
jgi:hypothetical protein